MSFYTLRSSNDMRVVDAKQSTESDVVGSVSLMKEAGRVLVASLGSRSLVERIVIERHVVRAADIADRYFVIVATGIGRVLTAQRLCFVDLDHRRGRIRNSLRDHITDAF